MLGAGTYRFFPGSVRFPFGHGLTVGAEFSYKYLAASSTKLSATTITSAVTGPGAVRGKYTSPALVNATISVTNLGSRSAAHSVLLFASPPNAGKDGAPLKSLVAFERIPALEPQASAVVSLPLNAWAFALADADGAWGATAGTWTLTANNGSKAGSEVSASLTIG